MEKKRIPALVFGNKEVERAYVDWTGIQDESISSLENKVMDLEMEIISLKKERNPYVQIWAQTLELVRDAGGIDHGTALMFNGIKQQIDNSTNQITQLQQENKAQEEMRENMIKHITDTVLDNLKDHIEGHCTNICHEFNEKLYKISSNAARDQNNQIKELTEKHFDLEKNVMIDIDKLQQETKSLRDDVNYLREKILLITSPYQGAFCPPHEAQEEMNLPKSRVLSTEELFDKAYTGLYGHLKPKRNFEILFASNKEILVKEQRGIDELDVYYCYDVYTEINIEERAKEIKKTTDIYTPEQFEQALKEFKDDERARAYSFNLLQQDHICYVIGEWYLKWKNKDLNSHIGRAKEELKEMICNTTPVN